MDKKKEPTKVSPINQEDHTSSRPIQSMDDFREYVETLKGLGLPEGSTTVYKVDGYIRIVHIDGNVAHTWHRLMEGEEGTYETYILPRT